MDTALDALFSWQFLLFCLAISAVTYVITIIVEYCFKKAGKTAKQNMFWTDLTLPILPIVFGCISAILAKKYPFPVEIVSVSGRAIFGLCAGMLSSVIWRWIKSVILMKINPSQTTEATKQDDIVK
jgi:hypothetical protein